jgi:excisionase family DNA binding protein
MTDAEALTIPEACAASRIGRTKIYEAINEGRLVARKLGKKTLILRSDLREFLTTLPTATESAGRWEVRIARPLRRAGVAREDQGNG